MHAKKYGSFSLVTLSFFSLLCKTPAKNLSCIRGKVPLYPFPALGCSRGFMLEKRSREWIGHTIQDLGFKFRCHWKDKCMEHRSGLWCTLLSQPWFSVLIEACFLTNPQPTKPGVWGGNGIPAVAMLSWASERQWSKDFRVSIPWSHKTNTFEARREPFTIKCLILFS